MAYIYELPWSRIAAHLYTKYVLDLTGEDMDGTACGEPAGHGFRKVHGHKTHAT